MQATPKPLPSPPRRLRDFEASMSDGVFVALALVLFLLLSAPLFLNWPPPNADEEMFGDVARTLAYHGRLASTLVAGQENAMYWQPPLYFLLLAPAIKLFGWSLAVLRGFSLIVGLVIIVLTHSLGTSLTSRLSARIGTVLLVCNPHFLTYVKLGRMDGLCVLFVLVSLLLTAHAIPRKGSRAFVLPGIASAAAVLTHPLGLIAPVTVLLWLLVEGRNKQIDTRKNVAFFLLPVVAALGLWLIYVLQDPHAFLVQMQYQLARKDRGWLVSFLGFARRYRFLPFFAVLGVMGAFATWDIWRRMRQDSALLLLVIANAVAFFTVVLRFEVTYPLYWTPVASLAAGVAAVHLSKRWRNVFGFLILAALLNGLAFVSYLTYVVDWKERSAAHYEEVSRAVAVRLPLSCSVTVVGPSLYWNILEQRPDVHYTERIYFDSTLARDVVARLDYAILTRSFAPQEDAPGFSSQLLALDSLAGRVKKKVIPLEEIGEERQFVLSARMYRLVPDSSNLQIPP